MAFRYIDVILALIALPVLLALGAPTLGSAVGVGVWVASRGLQALNRRWIDRLGAPGSRLRASVFEPFARIWLLAGGIVVAGVAGQRRDGLTAALVIFGAYSVAFAVRLVTGFADKEKKR